MDVAAEPVWGILGTMLCGMLVLALLAGIVLVMVLLSRRGDSSKEMAALREENARLREEIERLRRKHNSGSTGITDLG
jgi:uncharacterized membrane protein affecting hemolysin expression